MSKIRSGARLARLKLAAELGRPVTQQEVAAKIGITKASLSQIELGKVVPRHETLVALCQFYGISIGELLIYEPENLDSENEPGNSLALPLAA